MPDPAPAITRAGPLGFRTASCCASFRSRLISSTDSVFWDFDDGTYGTGKIVTHFFYTISTQNIKCEVWKNCVADSTFEPVWTNCFFGVEEMALLGITVYPNPTTNKLRVQQFGQDAQNVDFKIYDVTGKILLSVNDASEINVSALPKGIYMLEIQIDKKFSRQRFVKN